MTSAVTAFFVFFRCEILRRIHVDCFLFTTLILFRVLFLSTSVQETIFHCLIRPLHTTLMLWEEQSRQNLLEVFKRLSFAA